MKHLKQSLCCIITLLFCALLSQYAFGQTLPLPNTGNVQVNGVDQGPTYIITSGANNYRMIFTAPTAVVSLNTVTGLNKTWGGEISMQAAGVIATQSTVAGQLPNLTVNGVLSGNQDLTKTGDGKLIFTNSNNTHRGTITVNAGTVAISDAGQLSGSLIDLTSLGSTLDISGATSSASIGGLSGVFGSVVKLDTKELVFGGNNANTTYDGFFDGSGTLTKVGTGTVTLTGDSTTTVPTVLGPFTGNISVDKGTLLVNGNVSGSALAPLVKTTTTVKQGAVLGGNGTLGNVTVNAGGMLAPSVLTADAVSNEVLTISGQLDAQANSKIVLRVNDKGAFEQIKVGTVSVGTDWNNVNLEMNALAGDYSDPPGVTILGPMITANGTVDLTTWSDWELRQKFLNLNTTTGNITRKTDYFQNPNVVQTHNQQEVGRVLDASKAGTSDAMWEMMTRLSWLIGDDPTTPLSPDRIYAAYSQMTGDLRAHAITLGQWKTSQYGLAHLDLTEHGLSEKNSVWFQAIHQTTDFEGDGNASAYGISRTGGIFGSEEVVGDDTLFGFFVGFSRPYIYNQGNSVEANDLQFGFYGGSRLHRFLDTKLFVGYGHQSYDQKRYITDSVLLDDGPVQQISSRYKGDSMSMSCEIGVPLEGGLFSLRPLAAVDSDLTWVYNTDETGSSGLEQRFAREFYEKTLARAGLTAQFGSVMYSTPLSLTGRAFYARQISGDSHTTSRAAFLGDTSQWMSIYGIEQGKDYMTGGLGFRWTISESRSFYGDYDYTTSDRSRAHSASLGYMQKW
ncbi:MAG: autotransporter outer membrane beta-barrel domain-containing protein [Thermoguttaceae bacterium]